VQAERMGNAVRGITFYRRQRRLTQTELADLVGVRQPYICAIETGRANPSDRLLEKLAHALGVTPAISLLRPVTAVSFEAPAEPVA
jgi:transcriptional regulator with XRE-family HTH domain